MSKHSEAFKAWVEVQHYCEDRECDDCCFSLGKDHDSEGYCPFDTYFLCPPLITEGLHEEISKRVYFLEQLELEKYEQDNSIRRNTNELHTASGEDVRR